MTRSSAKRTAGALAGGLVLLLTACSSGDPTSAASASPASTGTATASPSAPTGAATTPAADAPGEVSAAKLCEYLSGQLPTLRGVGSEVGAMANLTGNLFGWYGEQGAVPDGAELDTLTKAQCPDVGTEVLTLAGVESFTAL